MGTSDIRPALFVSHSSADAQWAEEIHRLLDAHGYGAFLDSHPDDGIQVGEEWQQTLWTRLRQSSGVIVLCSRDWLRSPWCLSEALVAHERGKTMFVLVKPDVPDSPGRKLPGAGDEPSVPGFLRDVQFLRLAERSQQEVENRLLRGINNSLMPGRMAVREPYRGLLPYEEADAGVFFGRDPEVDQLIRILNRRRRRNVQHGFVLVLGASGSGKSSLVRAGVLPRLRGADGGTAWLVAPPVRAGEGIEGLAVSLAKLDGADDSGQARLRSIRERLAACLSGPAVAPGPLQEVVREALLSHDQLDAHLVLVLDQLEEVFRDAGTGTRRALELVLAACAQPSSRLVALATMRSEYLNNFQMLPAVSEGYEEMTLDPMPRERFTDVIARPAAVVGLELEPGLAERLATDTGHDDALPLLAYALRELYQSFGSDGDLTLAEYELRFPPVRVLVPDGSTAQVQGVSAAVKAVADEILIDEGYRQLPDDHPRLRDLRSAALRLADYSDGEPVRATVHWSAMPSSCERVLRRFESERLLVSGVDSRGEPTVTVAHEAFFRVWDRFQRWLADSQDVLAVRGQVRRAAAEWIEAGRAARLVWTDERVVDAMQQMCRGGIACAERDLDATHPLSTTEREFLGPLTIDEILASLEKADLTLAERGRLGVRLALLGDTRHGVGLDSSGLPDLAWDSVEGGTVVLRDPTPQEWTPLAEELSRLTGGSIPDPASSTSRRHLEDSRPQAVASFEMSRYLVTWSQLRAFRTATDYADSQWWDRPPYEPNERPGPPQDSPQVPENHPATHLTWYEARAFCRWLTGRLGSEPPIRLPTEHEWQIAATGGDPARLYPWGNELRETTFTYANTFEGRIQAQSHLAPTTTAVGLFPRGRSRHGLMDMSGNAWEWCDSAFSGTQDNATDDGPRVVRGGSWVIGMPACTTVYSGQLDPSAAHYFVGFRPVRSLPLTSHPALVRTGDTAPHPDRDP